MALRDCTLFVQVPKELVTDPNGSEAPSGVERQPYNRRNPSPFRNVIHCEWYQSKTRIIIADLDEKSEAHRGEYWQSLEDSLIKGRYYQEKAN